MDVLFDDKNLVEQRKRKGRFSDCYKQINRKIEQFLSVDNLERFEIEFPQNRCHEYSGSGKGTYTVDISGNRRLRFRPTETPPKKPDGGIDKSKITSITIIDVIDPH